MLSVQIKHIKYDLNKYKDMSPNELLTFCINDKLQGTLNRYNEEIKLNSDYLLTRSSFRVLKALTKLQKKADKAVLESLAEIENKLNTPIVKEEDEDDYE